MNPFLQAFSIGGCEVAEGGAPILITETACAHEGSAELAKKLIDGAARAGADMVQLQVFRAAEQVPESHRLYPLLQKLEMSDHEWSDVFRHAAGSGRDVMAFVYDVPSLRVALDNGVVALKLNSSDLLNSPLLKECGESGLPIFLGTGASTVEEISGALRFLAEAGASKIVLMHGVQDFPTSIGDSRLNRLRLLKDVFHMPVGYGDHTDASLPLSRVVDLASLGFGIVALEKHITLDRASKGTDHQAALEPEEWREWADLIRETSKALVPEVPADLSAADKRYRLFQKKYAVAFRNLETGDVPASEDVRFLRLEEEGEISALEFETLRGQSLKRDVKKGEPLRKSDFL